MKKVFLILSTLLLSTAFIISGCQNSPLKKSLQVEVIYQDAPYRVTSEGSQIIVTNGKSRKVIPTKDSSFSNASRIKNKRSQALPMKGTYIKDGLLIEGQKNSYLFNLAPEIKLLAAYPNPNSKDQYLLVHKKNNLLYLYDQGLLVKKYAVATGKEEHFTPEGSFKIINKFPIKEGDDPDNLYGPRWLGLAVSDAKDKRANDDQRAPVGHKYGIHGTNEPDSIGTHASGGCIRLSNEDILELYPMVPVGTKVVIRNQ